LKSPLTPKGRGRGGLHSGARNENAGSEREGKEVGPEKYLRIIKGGID